MGTSWPSATECQPRETRTWHEHLRERVPAKCLPICDECDAETKCSRIHYELKWSYMSGCTIVSETYTVRWQIAGTDLWTVVVGTFCGR
jgi:hypothetical protein